MVRKGRDASIPLEAGREEINMPITVKRLHPLFVGEVGGVDLTRPIPPEQFAEIEAAFNENAVLVFRNQPVTDEQQVAFSALFGPVFKVTNYHRENEKRRLREEMSDISNIDHEGKLLAANDERRLHNRANQLWHTDNSFKHVPARASLLSARVIPPGEGDTEFADMRAAYDALPDARKKEIEDLVVEHSIFHSRARMGIDVYTSGARTELPPVQQVLVRRHPGSGRKALYIASHASHVVGWPIEKGKKLINDLLDFATQPQFVYRHKWTEGDLIIWDNRCTMHRATPYDEMAVKRILHRTTVSDEVNTVERRDGERHNAA
jgi:alpha-ketoglutarate-dependent 2,4-dichlorophenoxyacetate dioxygenase